MPVTITSLVSLTVISHKARLLFRGDESALTEQATPLGRVCYSHVQNTCKITELLAPVRTELYVSYQLQENASGGP